MVIFCLLSSLFALLLFTIQLNMYVTLRPSDLYRYYKPALYPALLFCSPRGGKLGGQLRSNKVVDDQAAAEHKGELIMTNYTNDPTVTQAERERRRAAEAASHGGVEVLDADRPAAAGAPNITHQTTTDPYRPDPYTPDPRLGDPVIPGDRSIVEPAAVDGDRGRSTWGTILAGLVIVLIVLWLLTWIF